MTYKEEITEESIFVNKDASVTIQMAVNGSVDVNVTFKINEVSTVILVDNNVIGTIDTPHIYEFNRVLKETLDFIG